jgi:protein involved in polysaccharide export with SLBB domain
MRPLIRLSWRPLPDCRCFIASLAAALWVGLVGSAAAQTTANTANDSYSVRTEASTQETPGVIHLRDNFSDAARSSWDRASQPANESPPPLHLPGEFELFVNRVAGTSDKAPVRRFGVELVSGLPNAQDFAPQVPPDYLISPGDEIVLTIWGSVDGTLRLVVDRAGRVSIPRVGTVMVSGVRYADLANVIRQQVAQVFKNFQLSASLGRLRSIRIYVTGFTQRPGSYTLSSLSTIVNALMQTGGPSAAGSFRNIELHRSGKLLTTFDLYDLLLRGDRTADRVLQAEDVIQIGPVGPQVAVIGSVNKPAIFELRNGETVSDVLRMAAGFTAVADRSRLAVERLTDRESIRVSQLSLPADANQKPGAGDILRAFSLVDAVLPVQRQNKRVHVEGEVSRPGDYVLPSDSTIGDALRAAGGLTPSAYVFGTEFNRESVRVRQQENYDRALRDLETQFTLTTTTQRALSADEAQAQATRATGGSRLIERLRAVRPTGRIVLQMSPDAHQLPDLMLEDGDRLYIPARPNTVGVFGSVFNGGSYLYARGNSIEDYLRLAGGATRGADPGSTFVLRANGTVVSSRQRYGWFGLSSGLGDVGAEPGDTIFVPEEINKTTFAQEAKEWTQILYQFGLGAAALKTIRGN